MNDKNTRIKDIARLAGVSVGTVDRVIHDRGNVSQKARKKIMEVLKETGYKPNLLARMLGSNKRFVIATLTPTPDLDEYWEQSDTGIKEAGKEWAQYNVEIRQFHFDLYNKASFLESAKEVRAINPDAILSSPIFHHEGLDFFSSIKDDGIPYVFFNSNISDVHPACFIGQDLYQSGKLCAELLDMNGARNGTFAVLHVYEDIHNSVHLAEKERGFKDYFKEKNNNCFKIVVHDYSQPDNDVLEKKLIKLLSNPEIKGIHVTTSKGVYIIAAFLEKAKRDDIRLVGYDLLKENIQYLKKGIVDFLIHQNPKKQASLGISYLVNLLVFNKEIPNNDFFPLEIITRQNLESFLEANH